ncbi:MAG: hypothetical protein SX243_04985 [Acidobacteriota bacterium]|nr:hypothetical protein [Acidobacteriota bacterium]
MDPQKLKEVYHRLEALDERLTYKVRPRSGGGLSRPSVEQLEERHRHLAEFTVELKDIVHGLIVAIATRPKPKS